MLDSESDFASSAHPSPSAAAAAVSSANLDAPLDFNLLSPTDNNTNPELPPAVAATFLRKLVAVELVAAGFDSAEPEALDVLEGIVYAFFGSLIQHSHELAELAHRTKPTLKDIVKGCASLGVGGAVELADEAVRERSDLVDPQDLLITYESAKVEASPALLESDDDDDEMAAATEKRMLPFRAPYLPPLPPKHAYRSTPVYPTTTHKDLLPTALSSTLQPPSQAAQNHLSTLHSRLHNSQLVAASLRNLVRGSSSLVEGAAGAAGVPGGDEDDVVDFEGEWYGATAAAAGVVANGGGRLGRRKEVLRVGMTRKEEEGKGMVGQSKKRRWRV